MGVVRFRGRSRLGSDLMKLHFNPAMIDSSGNSIGRRKRLITDGSVASMPTSGNVFPRAMRDATGVANFRTVEEEHRRGHALIFKNILLRVTM